MRQRSHRFFAIGFLMFSASVAMAQTSVLAKDAHLNTTVAGLERTDATARVIPATGPGFSRALQVVLKRPNAETNATQLTLLNAAPVQAEDVMLASFYIRGRGPTGPVRAEFMFEKSSAPWTKSVTYGVVGPRNGSEWRRVSIPFRVVGNYGPGEAMASLRLALQPQTVEIGGLMVMNYGRTRTLESLVQAATAANPLGNATVKVNLKQTAQLLRGLGGNFCQPRYGSTEPLDAVGRYTLANLKVVNARIGLPLNHWNPEPGVYKDDAQARASLLALQEMKRRGIPTMVSIWEGPGWMLGGEREQMGRTLPVDKYDACIDAIVRYLKLARDEYGVNVEYVSFNEPDYGVNFKFTPAQMGAFIQTLGPRLRAAGLGTKFLVGDTANGVNFYDYAKPLLEDPDLKPFLGPLSFHSWDVLSASELSYRRIAELGKRHGKEVWCMEAGHDAQLWQAKDPWSSWENGIRTALAYERLVRLSGASLISYWTYQDNYPLVDGKTGKPYPVFHVMKQMEGVLGAGYRVASAISAQEDLQVLATVRGKSFGVLMVNPIGLGQVTLRGLPPGARVAVETSDAGATRRRSAARVSATGTLTVSVPVRSVVTVTGS